MTTIGFIGLGTMGSPMAANLLKAGHALLLKSGRQVPPDLTEAAGRACGTAREIAEGADVVVLMLPDTPQVEEVLVFASKAGADPARVREALMGGFASSRILEMHGERMVRRTFDPGFRIELHQKDLNLALDSGRALGVPLPGTAAAQQLFSACVAKGGGGRDHSAIVTALETLAAHEIG